MPPIRTATSSEKSVPLSLGKPSLRRRLEAYYRQVAPDQIENQEEWKNRFDKIWEKFGGSIGGEQQLAAKLKKKYGSVLQLEIVTVDGKPTATTAASQEHHAQQEVHVNPEEYYELTPDQRGSGILSFAHANFDPYAALASGAQTLDANPWLVECSLLDRVEQCRSLLPFTDPLFRPASVRALKRPAETDLKISSNNNKTPSTFVAIATMYREGPLSLLYETLVRRKRVRVIVRYVDGIRGTLTGHLLAFDKHYNLLLKDVEEVYTPRQPRLDETSNEEREVARRRTAYAGNRGNGETWTCRQRHMKQLMVRGDNVVAVYKPELERSCWPVTRKSPPDTIYRKQSAKRHVPPLERVGTPGSLGLSSRRHGNP